MKRLLVRMSFISNRSWLSLQSRMRCSRWRTYLLQGGTLPGGRALPAYRGQLYLDGEWRDGSAAVNMDSTNSNESESNITVGWGVGTCLAPRAGVYPPHDLAMNKRTVDHSAVIAVRGSRCGVCTGEASPPAY